MGYLRYQICGAKPIYGEMRLKEAQDYECYKQRAKQRFGLTVEHHSRELRNVRKKHDEIYTQAVVWIIY